MSTSNSMRRFGFLPCRLLLATFLLGAFASAFGQSAPSISYTTPQVLVRNTAVTINPTNSGGSVPARNYLTTSVLAGSSTASGTSIGTGAAARFNKPVGIAIDPTSGDMYVADTWNHLIRKVTSTGVVSTIAGTGSGGYSNNNNGTSAQFNYPTDLAIHPDGSCLYVADKLNHVIRKVTLTSPYKVETFAGVYEYNFFTFSTVGGSTVGTMGSDSRFNQPEGIFFDGSNSSTHYLYIADRANNKIRRITLSATSGTATAGPAVNFAGDGNSGSTEGPVGTARFNNPVQVAVSANGNTVYVADFGNNKIRQINSNTVSTLAGSGTPGGDNATGGASATFNGPYGIEVDGAGNIIVSEQSGHRIRRITTGGTVSTLAGSGTAGTTDGVGTLALLNEPSGMVFNPALGILFICEYATHRIRQLDMSGYVVSPALPNNLALDASTGIITGTPTTLQAASDYTVSAFNYYGTSTTTLNLTIAVLPVLTTTGVTSITTTTASTGGNISSDGGSAVIARGVVYGTSSGPTVSGSKTTNGTGTGSFSSALTGLTPNTVYYLRAYATTAAGTAYGNEVIFQPTIGPTCTAFRNRTTTNSTGLGSNDIRGVYVSGGTLYVATAAGLSISTDGGNTFTNKTTADGLGSNSVRMVFVEGSNIYAATNGGLSISTNGGSTFTNRLPTYFVLSTTKVGSTIYAGTNGGVFISTDGGANFTQKNNTNSGLADNFVYGIAASGSTVYAATDGGFCISTDGGNTFTTNFSLPSANTRGVTLSGGNIFVSTPAGLSISRDGGQTFTTKTKNDGIGGSTSSNVFRVHVVGSTVYAATNAGLSISTNDGSTFTSYSTSNGLGSIYLNDVFATESDIYVATSGGLSTCIQVPTLTTTAVTSVTGTTASSGGNVTSDGGGTITGRGVVYSSSPNPTVSGTGTSNGTGTGSFSSALTGLTPNTLYYLRAYATNAAGTAYGTELQFTTLALPTVSTTTAGSITGTGASSGGNVTSEGGASVTAKGVVWSTTANPTVSLSTKTTDGTGTGSFTSTITGLSPATTYNYRAYATSSVGTAYGTESQFTTLALPTVTTTTAGSITTTGASSGGNVTSDGGSAVTARGVVWSTTSGPTVSLSTKTTDGTGTGSFTSTITGLSSNTTYYVRAYATTATGTAYGSEVSFTTLQVAPNISYSPSTVTLSVGTAASVPLTSTGGTPDLVQVSTLAGNSIAGYLNGTGTSARFFGSQGVAVDGSGNVYVAEAMGHVIRKITPAGVVTTLAGPEPGVTPSSGSADGTGTAARFNFPSGVAVDLSGNIYVADSRNHRIRKVTSAGEVTTLAGSTEDYFDGTGTAARFNNPSGVAVDGSGNVYVTDYINHRIRKVTSDGVVTTLAGAAPGAIQPNGSNDGLGTVARFNSPQGVAVDGSGNVYVVDWGNNRIRKITISGSTATVTTLAGSDMGTADGTGTSAQFNRPTGVAIDGSGNLYVTEQGTHHRIRKITPAGVVTTLAGNSSGYADGAGTNAQFNQPYGIAMDGSGNLYVADGQNFRIRRISRYSISPSLPAGLTFDPATGTISGTPTTAMAAKTYTVYAQNSGGAVTTNITISVTGLPTVATNAATNVTVTTATLNATVNANGGTTSALTIKYSTVQATVDAGNGTSATVSPTSVTGNTNTPISASISGLTAGTTYYFRVSATVTGVGTTNGSTLSFTTRTPAPNISYAGASSPVSLSVGTPMSSLTVTNTAGAIEPMQVTTLAGSSRGTTDGTGTSAKFRNPTGVALDGNGNMYIADKENHRIRKIVIATAVVSTLTGNNGTWVDGTLADARFRWPYSVSLDGSGNLYVADYSNNRIRKITPAGMVETLAGTGDRTYIDGPGATAAFSAPSGVAVYGGNLYVADYNNHRIRKISLSTGVVTTLAGPASGVSPASGFADGVPADARFRSPTGVAVDGSENVYVADLFNHCIRKVTSAGVVTTLAGSSGTSGSADGTGTSAQFNQPYGIAVYSGNAYVADRSNHLIRKIDLSNNAVTTLAGSNFGWADGMGTSAQFNNPTGITVDGSGNIYVADESNHRIRRISRYSISPELPAGLTFDPATGTISGTPTAITPSQVYTVKASNGGGDGNATFTLSVSSSILTTAASAITETTATSGGTVDATQFAGATQKGVCWNTTGNPEITDPKTTEGSGTGVFTSNLTGLDPNTTYYVRSYVTVGSTTTYGNEVSFKTKSTTAAMSNVTKTFGDPAFIITNPSANNSSGGWSYTSGSTGVATIIGNTVTIAGAGTSTITATQAASGAYGTTTTSFTLTVNGQTPTIILGIPITTQIKDAGSLTITPTSNSGGSVSLSLGSGSISGVTLNGSGSPYTLSAVTTTGNLVFVASVPATGNYAAGTLTQTMDVTKNNPSISFNALSAVTYSSGLTQTLTATGGGSSAPVTFSVVSGPGSITSGSSTLNISGPGDIVVKASQAGDVNYNPAPDVVRTLTVNPAAPTITSFTPTSATEGDVVTITGTNFQNVTEVSFGGTAATSFNVVSATSITAVLGTGHTGSVSVTTTGGTDTEPGFRYKVTWTGATNAFNTSSNWTGNRPPQTDDDIIFSPTAASDLELDASKTVGHVDFNGSGKSLKLGAYNLTVKGNLTMPGNITGSGKVIMQGGAAQTIRGGGDIPDLEINNSNGVTIDAAGDELTVSGTLRSTSGTLTTNGKLRLTSNSGGTARVGVVAGTITGNVIAERYIKRNDNTDGTGRAWRLVSVPVTGTGILRDFFMNGRNGQDLTLTASRDAETDNSGTPIVGHNYATASEATTAGFDWIGVANSVSSLRSYVGDAGGGNFASENVPTMTTTYAAAAQGYMVFARGDRKLDFPSSSSSGATTFRSTGALKTGNQTVTVDPSSTSKYTLVGNPYMSVLDLSAMYASNSSVINASFWIWDANIAGSNKQGGYVNVYKSGTQWVTNTGTYVNPELLESGMAFFVEPVSSSSSGTLTISESHKSSAASAGLSPFSTDKPDDHGRMYVRLERADDKGRRQIIDGVMADFHSSFKEILMDMSDREKLRNGISRGALWIPREGKILSGEGLPWPKDVKRSIPLSMSGVGDQTLLVHINPTGMRDRYVKAWLKDNVLKREIEINMSQPTDYDFIGTGRADWDSTRFEIVYVEAGRPGTGVTLEPDDAAETPSVKLYPNPSKTAEVKLSLRAMAPGMYTVQVLDMTGRLVATSMLEHRSVNGEYRVLQGRLLSPGKYLLRLSLEGRLVQTLQLIHE